MKKLSFFRYYLEIISIPLFALLVIHTSGHGLMLIFNEKHQHSGETILGEDLLWGSLALVLFYWIWKHPVLKNITPCRQNYCHHKNTLPHILASVALIFHFFPESTLRYQMLKDFHPTSLLSLAGGLGFFSHFLIDVIIAVLLSSFWKKLWQKILYFLTISTFWIGALWVGKNGGFHETYIPAPLLLLASGFLLTMFIHKPHKPLPYCQTCQHPKKTEE